MNFHLNMKKTLKTEFKCSHLNAYDAHVWSADTDGTAITLLGSHLKKSNNIYVVERKYIDVNYYNLLKTIKCRNQFLNFLNLLKQ